MAVVQRIPQKLEEVLGREGSDQFIDFLNVTFHSQEERVVQLVEDKFEKTVTEEVSKVRLEVAKLDTKIAELRAEVKTDIGKLDTKIAEVRTEIADLRAEMKSDIANQTKWIFSALIGAAVLYPIVSKLMQKFLP